MSTSKNTSGVGITDLGEFAHWSTTAIPNFNPYDALGIPIATYTIDKCSPPPTTPGSGTSAGTSILGFAHDGDFLGYTHCECTPPFGISAYNPYIVNNEDNDKMPPPPTPTPSSTSIGSGTSIGQPLRVHNAPPPLFALFGFGRQVPPPLVSPFGFTCPPTSSTSTSILPPLASMPRENQSIGATCTYASPIANPVTSEYIIVRTWATSPYTIPNAVVAIFDVRGRLNFCITNTTTTGVLVLALTLIVTSIRGINFYPPYTRLDLNAL
ncbi:hypothetical protein V490_00477 [Pseudogymnoascus sp. VKM F-3557]|nr:hypothetical protein V490_00477 [Pseudogymnoascus sp. VKM F-3557]